MMTDPMSDMLTRIRNALLMRQEQTNVPHSRLKEAVLQVLKREGFIHGFETVGTGIKKALVVRLKYGSDGASAINGIHRVSRCSRRFFRGYADLKQVRDGLGVRVLTTSKGVVSDQEARQKKLGGEILLEVW